MDTIILSLISFGTAAFAFAFGAIRLFGKKTAMYFQLIVCSAGCYALEELASLVTYLCGGFEYPITVNSLGAFGCFFFLLSANYGQIDGIVDDGSPENRKARLIALSVSCMLGVFLAFCFVCAYFYSGTFAPFALAFIYTPILFASYYNLKHLLLPTDPLGLLHATKACNIWALIFYAAQMLYLFVYLFCTAEASHYIMVFLSAALLGMVLAAVKGDAVWKTSI